MENLLTILIFICSFCIFYILLVARKEARTLREKYGLKSNQEFIKLSKNGPEDIKAYRKKGLIITFVMLASGNLCIIILHNFWKN